MITNAFKTVALNHDQIKSHSERILKIKLLTNQ